MSNEEKLRLEEDRTLSGKRSGGTRKERIRISRETGVTNACVYTGDPLKKEGGRRRISIGGGGGGGGGKQI